MNLTAQNIRVILGGKEILRGISHTFAAGKRTAIVGANGLEEILRLNEHL